MALPRRQSLRRLSYPPAGPLRHAMPSPKREAKAAMVDRSDPLWFKDAIIYQLHVKAFFDSTNDGIGDIGGLIQKLDYVRELGVTAIWLLPFYPSPLRDDGYDIADYRAVNRSEEHTSELQSLMRSW